MTYLSIWFEIMEAVPFVYGYFYIEWWRGCSTQLVVYICTIPYGFLLLDVLINWMFDDFGKRYVFVLLFFVCTTT